MPKLQSKIKRFLGLESPDDFQIVYFRFAKTAGVFLNCYFNTYYHGKIVTVLHPKPYKKETCLEDLVGRFDRYFKFTMVRNPWAWQVSFYSHFCQSWQNPNREQFQQEFPTFKDWLEKRELHTLEKYAGNFQWENNLFRQICYYKNAFLPDFVGKIEFLEEDLAKMFKLSGLKIKKPITDFKKENKENNFIADRKDIEKNVINASKHQHYSLYYTDEQKNLVYEKNREFIDNYHYEFEDIR